MLILALMAAILGNAAAVSRNDCPALSASALAVDASAFDETPHQGWRMIADAPGCLLNAANAIADYRHTNAQTLVDDKPERLRSLDWHEGQLRAAIGQTAQAVDLLKRGSKQESGDGDGLYHQATIAFLMGDRPRLVALRGKTASLSEPSGFEEARRDAEARGLHVPSWPIHLREIDGLIACLGQPYVDAYYGKCSDKLRKAP